MLAAGIQTFGGEVRILDLPAPARPAPDEVVISVHAAGVGNWDEIVRVGDWDVGRRPPLALGVEAAGVVAAVGEDVTSLAPGDEVLTHPVPLRHQGAWPADWPCSSRSHEERPSSPRRVPRARRASAATARASCSTITIPSGRPACETHPRADVESGPQ